jgi:hypothetical protein
MDWVNLTGASLTISGLSGTSPEEVVKSLLEKIEAEALENLQVSAQSPIPILRLDGVWYSRNPFLIRLITPAPVGTGELDLDAVIGS